MIPSIEASQLALVVKDPVGRSPASCPGTTRCCCWRGSSHRRSPPATRPCRKPSELTPLSTLALAPCFDHLPAGVVNVRRRRGASRRAASSADERIECVAFTGSVATGKRIAAVCAERVARVNLEMGGKDPFIVCAGRRRADRRRRQGRRLGRVPQRRPGLHLGGALLRPRRRLRRLPAGVRRTTPARFGIGDPLDPTTDVGPDGLGRPAREGRRPGRGGGRGRRRAGVGRRRGRPGARPLLLARGGHRRRRRDRPASRGDLRARGADRPRALARRGDRARELDPLRPRRQRLHRGPADVSRCMREIKAGTVWFNDPADRQRRRPVRRLPQSGLGRELGREGLEAFQETKHVHIETEIDAEGMVVPVWSNRIPNERQRIATRHNRLAPPRRARTLRNYVGGGWVEAAGERLDDRNPATGELVRAGAALRRRGRRRSRSRAARDAQPAWRAVAAAEPRPGGDGAPRGALGEPGGARRAWSPRTWARRSTTPAARSCAESSRPRRPAAIPTCSRARASRASRAASTSSSSASRSASSARSPRSTSRR